MGKQVGGKVRGAKPGLVGERGVTACRNGRLGHTARKLKSGGWSVVNGSRGASRSEFWLSG